MPESPTKTNEIPAFAGMTSLKTGELFKWHSLISVCPKKHIFVIPAIF
jgi:hypothetical protein